MIYERNELKKLVIDEINELIQDMKNNNLHVQKLHCYSGACELLLFAKYILHSITNEEYKELHEAIDAALKEVTPKNV